MTIQNGTLAGQRAPFGEVLGYGPGQIPAYSSDYKSCRDMAALKGSGFEHKADGQFFGAKWQCVEYARRWLIKMTGYTFEDVHMAYQIFEMKNAVRLSDGAKVPFKSVLNGSKNDLPKKGDLLIWDHGGFFENTGHVAIVTAATGRWVRVAEQNVEDLYWHPGCDYGRELPVEIDSEGGYHIAAVEIGSTETGSVRGWMHIVSDT